MLHFVCLSLHIHPFTHSPLDGQVRLLDWFKDQKLPGWDSPSIKFSAAMFPKLDAMQWCLKNLTPHNRVPVDCLQYFPLDQLKDLEIACGYDWICEITLADMFRPVRSGNVDVMQYMLKKVRFTLDRSSSELVLDALDTSREMVRFLIEQCGLPVNDSVIVNASARGNEDILRYFYEDAVGRYRAALVASASLSVTAIRLCIEHKLTPVWKWNEYESESKLAYLAEHFPTVLQQAPLDIFQRNWSVSLWKRLKSIDIHPQGFALVLTITSISYYTLERVRYLLEEANVQLNRHEKRMIFADRMSLRRDVAEYLTRNGILVKKQ